MYYYVNPTKKTLHAVAVPVPAVAAVSFFYFLTFSYGGGIFFIFSAIKPPTPPLFYLGERESKIEKKRNYIYCYRILYIKMHIFTLHDALAFCERLQASNP